MIYFDTNILIYYCIKQDETKQKISQKLIYQAIGKNEFFISPAVLMEFIFAISKLKKFKEQRDKVDFFKNFVNSSMSKNIVLSAYEKCQKFNKCRNINDFIHLEIADRYCDKLITFDSDFKNLEAFYDIEIEILGSY